MLLKKKFADYIIDNSGKKISKTADFSSTSQRTGAMKRGTDFVKSMKKLVKSNYSITFLKLAVF